MILVDDHGVPLHLVQVLVLDLGLAVVTRAKYVLEGGEPDQRALVLDVRRFVLLAVEAPASEVLVREVVTPGLLDGWLVGEHEDAGPAHLLGQLVGGEGLTETHLGVPQVVGRLTRLGLGVRAQVGGGLLNSAGLLGAGLEVRHRPGRGKVLSLAHRLDGGGHLVLGRLEPLAGDVVVAGLLQGGVHLIVSEDAPVVGDSGLNEQDVGLGGDWEFDLFELLADADANVALGLSNLD